MICIIFLFLWFKKKEEKICLINLCPSEELDHGLCTTEQSQHTLHFCNWYPVAVNPWGWTLTTGSSKVLKLGYSASFLIDDSEHAVYFWPKTI